MELVSNVSATFNFIQYFVFIIRYIFVQLLFLVQLINYWPMSNLSDVVGGADLYNGTNYSYATDRLNNLNSSIYFNSGFLNIPSGVYFTGDFTITAWIQIKSRKRYARIVEFGNGAFSENSIYFGCQDLTSQLYLGIRLNSTTSSLTTPVTSVIELNIWYHVAAVLQGKNAYFYVNAIQVANGQIYSPSAILRKENYIGRTSYRSYYNADTDPDTDAIYDDIKLFKGALQSTDIMNDYSSSYTSTTPLSTVSSSSSSSSSASTISTSSSTVIYLNSTSCQNGTVCCFGSYGKNCGLKSNSTIFKNLPIEYSLKLVDLIGFSFNTTWSLIYKASINGFNASSFHSKCNGILNGTLTLVSTNNYSNIFGGYTKADWSGSGYKADSDAFLFSLVNAFNNSFKMPINSIFTWGAITARTDYGPIFGICRDFYINNNGSYGFYDNCVGAALYTYQFPSFSSPFNFLGGSNATTPDEIEVYERIS